MYAIHSYCHANLICLNKQFINLLGLIFVNKPKYWCVVISIINKEMDVDFLIGLQYKLSQTKWLGQSIVNVTKF